MLFSTRTVPRKELPMYSFAASWFQHRTAPLCTRLPSSQPPLSAQLRGKRKAEGAVSRFKSDSDVSKTKWKSQHRRVNKILVKKQGCKISDKAWSELRLRSATEKPGVKGVHKNNYWVQETSRDLYRTSASQTKSLWLLKNIALEKKTVAGRPEHWIPPVANSLFHSLPYSPSSLFVSLTMRVELRLSVMHEISCCSFIGREWEPEREGSGESELNFIHQEGKKQHLVLWDQRRRAAMAAGEFNQIVLSARLRIFMML